MPRVKQRTPELRDRVVDVAVSTLCEDGLSGLTTRRVAERAGTSVPAVYELFADKAARMSNTALPYLKGGWINITPSRKFTLDAMPLPTKLKKLFAN